jgi:hypothetical protein
MKFLVFPLIRSRTSGGAAASALTGSVTRSSLPGPAASVAPSSITKKLFWHCHIDEGSPFKAASSSTATPSSSTTTAKDGPTIWVSNAITKGQTFIANGWEDLSKKPPGSWQNRLFHFGESVLDRIPAEEWFLKEIPALPKERPEIHSTNVKVPVSSPNSTQL